MQSENFDKKIRDSLSQRPPGNDNPEWDKMEALLDKHLPVEKKDRRRFFFILLFLFLLTGGGAFLIWQNVDRDKNKIADIKSQDKKTGTAASTNSKPTTENIDANRINSEKEANDLNDQTNSVSKEITVPKSVTSSNDDSPPAEFTVINPSISKKVKEKRTDKPVIENIYPTEKTDNRTVENKEADKKQRETENVIKTETNPVLTERNEVTKADELQKPITENKIAEQKPETKESQPITTEKSNSQKQKNKNSFLNNLFFAVSAGPDFSSVGFDNPGKIQFAYGAGLGYKISNKFSVRTGFYSVKKVYAADPGDYHPPANFWAYYPNLENIDADCRVYEIPVMLDYTISSNKKQSWFVSGGVSSLLMKEETYEYYFKPNYSPTYVTYSRTIKDQNKHYFSQLNIAGGYTRNINKNISVRAEPYIKIAMNGVGFGKVNLNSGGVLFSAIIKPFARK